MKKKNNKEALSKVISLRISNHDFNLMANEAEAKNIGVPDVLRGAWSEHLSQQDLSTTLAVVEQRLVRTTFEVVCAVAGIDDHERLYALKKFRNRLKEGAKS